MSGLLIPSYGHGFARNAAESENPNLWKGLVGYWAPFLGPTGLTLHDWGGRKNDGTLTNMVPASDWVTGGPRGGGWVLDFGNGASGSNDWINCGQTPKVITGLTMSVWLKNDANNDANRMIFGQATTPDTNWALALAAANRFVSTVELAGVAKSASDAVNYPFGEWLHVVGRWDGIDVRLIVNNVFTANPPDNPKAAVGVINTAATITTIAARSAGNVNWTGQIAKAAYWDRALTPNEIAHLYAVPHALSELRRRVYPAGVAPAGAIMNQMQFTHLGADLYDGALIA